MNSLSLALGAFLLILVGGNFFLFFYIVAPEGQPLLTQRSRLHSTVPGASTINDFLNHLSPQYKKRNMKYEQIQKNLYKHYNFTVNNINPSLPDLYEWNDNVSLQSINKVLHMMKISKIMVADNAQRGTQLKLLLKLEGNKNLYFKPKRYDLNHIVDGNIYAGYDRHNSEVLGYYLAVVLNYKWVAPSVIRKINISKEIVPVAATGLRRTMINKGNNEWCIYGKCYYCKVNETVCGDEKNHLEGAAILYLDQNFKIHKSPWRRSYTSRKMEWQTNDNYCDQVKLTLSQSRILDLIEVSIFDFLIQNGDRHRYEVYNGRVMLLDNGKGLGNPSKDELDILAPLYQCCMIRSSTWQHLELLSGGILTQTIKTLSMFQGEALATESHYSAIERRLLIVYATVQRCIGKYGGARVFK